MIRVQAIVTGMVQGVGFRWSTREVAHRFGVVGFARNRHDGSVEVEIEGDTTQVDRMLDWLRTGPPGSRVTKVTVTELVPEGDDAFRIRESQ